MNYNSWKRKYPYKPFPYGLKRFGLFENTDLLTACIKNTLINEYQTGMSNYGTTIFFGNSYTISPTTILYSPPIENITFSYTI